MKVGAPRDILPVLLEHYVIPGLQDYYLNLDSAYVHHYLNLIRTNYQGYFLTSSHQRGDRVVDGDGGVLCRLRRTRQMVDGGGVVVSIEVLDRVRLGETRESGGRLLAMWKRMPEIEGNALGLDLTQLRYKMLALGRAVNNNDFLEIARMKEEVGFLYSTARRLLEERPHSVQYQRFLLAETIDERALVVKEMLEKELEEMPLGRLIMQIERIEGLDEEIKKQVQLAVAGNGGEVENIPFWAPKLVQVLTAIPWKTPSNWEVCSQKEGRKLLGEFLGEAEDLKRAVLDMRAEVEVLGATGEQGGMVQPLLLVGPPGIGKTSIIEAVAKMLKVPMAVINLGSVGNLESLGGFQRTFIGSREGMIIRRVCEMGCRNGILAFDEIDKLKDPASFGLLMELLDPLRRAEFRDQFVEYPVDLSKLLIVATANELSELTAPLVDRFRVVKLRGYSDLERAKIAKDYIVPKLLDRCGKARDGLSITDEGINQVAFRYTDEAGVRELERELWKLILRFVNEEKERKIIEESDVQRLLGIAVRDYHKLKNNGIGSGPVLYVWTTGGGMVGNMQTALLPGQGVELTGTVDQMHRETLAVARDYLITQGVKIGLTPEEIQRLISSRIHCHSDDMGIQKEGSSCGVIMFLTLYSALTQKVLPADLLVTGEITLDGRVRAVGGITEKLMAAERAGGRRVILPADNQEELLNIPEEIKQKVQVHVVETLQEVWELAFGLDKLPR